MFECIAKWATCGTIEDYGSYSKGRLKYTKYVLTFVGEFGISNGFVYQIIQATQTTYYLKLFFIRKYKFQACLDMCWEICCKKWTNFPYQMRLHT